MTSPASTTRGLILRLVLLVVWAGLVVVSLLSGNAVRIAIASVGFAATLATVVLWWVQRHRARPLDTRADTRPMDE